MSSFLDRALTSSRQAAQKVRTAAQDMSTQFKKEEEKIDKQPSHIEKEEERKEEERKEEQKEEEKEEEEEEEEEDDDVPLSVDEVDSPSIIPLTKGSSVHVPALSMDVQKAISAVLPPEDALDDQEFSSVAYINNMFPTEQSLVDIDSAVSRVRIKVAKLDADIEDAVREQAFSADDGREQLKAAQECVSQLFAKIADIQAKAEASESMVDDICRDIRSLDYAKRNLTASITTLKRLQMLTSGVSQLREMQRRREYDEASKILGAVQLFVVHFEDFHDVAQVKGLKDDVDHLLASFKEQIYGEFEALLRGDEPDAAACDAGYVLDALGPGVRQDFVLWFAGKQLGDYDAAFGIDSDYYGLEHTVKRFEWWERLITAYEDRWRRVFPEEWVMDEQLAEEFCSATKLALQAMLHQNRDTLQVPVLIGALQRCLAFEQSLCERFATDETTTEAEAEAAARAAAAGVAGGSDSEEEGNDELDNPALKAADEANPHSVDAVRRRYARFQREKRRATRAADKARAQAKRRVEKFAGMISSAFDGYLDLYIAQEDKQMGEALEKLMDNEKWPSENDPEPTAANMNALQSASDLVYYFKKSRTRCAALNKGQTLYELFLLFRRYLGEYAAYMARQLPVHSENVKALSVTDERRLALVVNTCEYMSATAGRIVEGFKRTIREKFHAQLHLKGVQTEFAAVIASTMKVFVGSLATQIGPSLQAMQKAPWGTWDSVGDTSEYVGTINRILAERVPLYNRTLCDKHSKYFCDQFVGDLIPRLIQTIYKTKRINEAGAQHLLLDMSVLKTTLLRLPTLGQSSAEDDDVDAAPASAASVRKNSRYAKFVLRSMLKLEILLKLVLSPPDLLLASYKQMAAELGAGALHGDDLQRVMELKGVRQSDQQKMLSTIDDDDTRVTSRLRRLFSTGRDRE